MATREHPEIAAQPHPLNRSRRVSGRRRRRWNSTASDRPNTEPSYQTREYLHDRCRRNGSRAPQPYRSPRPAHKCANQHRTTRSLDRKLADVNVLSEEGWRRSKRMQRPSVRRFGLNISEDAFAIQKVGKKHGADVEFLDGKDDTRAHPLSPRACWRALCKTAPSSFIQHARNPARNVEIGGKKDRLRPGLWPAVLPLLRRRPPLRDAGRFRDAGEADLHVPPPCITPAAPSVSRSISPSTSATSTWSTAHLKLQR